MSDRQAFIQALSRLPETAEPKQLLRAMYDDAVRRGAGPAAAALHRALWPKPEPEEYLNPPPGTDPRAFLDELGAGSRGESSRG